MLGEFILQLGLVNRVSLSAFVDMVQFVCSILTEEWGILGQGVILLWNGLWKLPASVCKY
ncbi:hypothetical protein MA16_Dca026526 [Dendrobium catenatum]|uniref:Uncharacterized protein n=1 Tax=Dendrobium catenatum TaxID=906689 RepID=A0A2I0W2N1_9ASPA|nr:hypothetical protein MA16_Dca026526 [Dendrobium catenatum]